MQLQSNVGVAFVTGLNIHQTFHWVSISWACMAVPGNTIQLYVSIDFNFNMRLQNIIQLSIFSNAFRGRIVILAVGLFWLPESPYYLVGKNRYDNKHFPINNG